MEYVFWMMVAGLFVAYAREAFEAEENMEAEGDYVPEDLGKWV